MPNSAILTESRCSSVMVGRARGSVYRLFQQRKSPPGWVRSISPDRSVIGLSSFQLARRFTDWSQDLCQLADQLSLLKFALLSWSAGSPYRLRSFSPVVVVSIKNVSVQVFGSNILGSRS
jgi:hypothetical protein